MVIGIVLLLVFSFLDVVVVVGVGGGGGVEVLFCWCCYWGCCVVFNFYIIISVGDFVVYIYMLVELLTN